MGKGANEMSRDDEDDVRVPDLDDRDDDDTEVDDEDEEVERQVSEIRENIEQTRVQMGGTIDEIQERLSPAYIKEQVKEQVKEQYEQAKETVREATIGKVEDMVERVSNTVYETRRGIVDTIKANPVPAALVGIGLAWMWMSGRENPYGATGRSYGRDPRGYDRRSSSFTRQGGPGVWERTTDAAGNLADKTKETMSDMVGQVQENAGDLAGRAKSTVSDVVNRTQETAGHLAEQAQHQARRAGDRVQTAMHETPLAVGAIALALGAGVGLAIPQTRKENDLMGETRDALVDRAQTAMKGTLDQVQQVAERVTDEVVGSGNQGRG
jgi:ElaB/YqjD/DUF883 family membrane-anchored ribosome-binding protein